MANCHTLYVHARIQIHMQKQQFSGIRSTLRVSKCGYSTILTIQYIGVLSIGLLYIITI